MWPFQKPAHPTRVFSGSISPRCGARAPCICICGEIRSCTPPAFGSKPRIAAAHRPGRARGVAPAALGRAQAPASPEIHGGSRLGRRVSPTLRCCALGRSYGSVRLRAGCAGQTGGVGHVRWHQGPIGSPASAVPGQLQQRAARCNLGRGLPGCGLRGHVPVPRSFRLPLCPPLPSPDLAVGFAALQPSSFGLTEPGGWGECTPGLRCGSAELPGSCGCRHLPGCRVHHFGGLFASAAGCGPGSQSARCVP